MVASLVRRAPLAAQSALGAALLIASTEPLAHQDLASLLVNQPGVAERARSFLRANPFAALRTATFSLPNPLGAAIPRLPLTDHFAVLNEVPRRVVRAVDADPGTTAPRIQIVNRTGKRDRLVPHSTASAPAVEPQEPGAPTAIKIEHAASSDDADRAILDHSAVAERADLAGSIARAIERVPPAGKVGRLSRLFFGADDGELPPIAFEHQPPSPAARLRLAALTPDAGVGSTSLATKGVVTGDEATPQSPAERLGLAGAARAKAEKCLADAVYFESRGEPERGQIAVAQVVMNRVFSGFYPEDVCGTVYQNAHRYLACQFTFACEGKKLVVNDADAWARATRIARDMLDGKLWLNDVGKATHYHAYWVRPWWTREMRQIQRIGVHTFYRPRAWEEEG